MVYKTLTTLACCICLHFTQIASIAMAPQLATAKNQFVSTFGGPFIGDQAPSFKAKSTKGTIHFPQDYSGKWVILFSSPSDFTPVGETELKKLAHMMSDFDKLHTKLVAISPDSKAMHQAWVNEIEKSSGFLGFGKTHIDFPIIADENMEVAQKYAMIHPNESEKQTVRSVYFVDPKGIIRANIHYPIGSGRNFDEVKRLLQSLQTTDGKKVATPAEWQPNKTSTTTPLEKEYKDVNTK